jgi:hypothetical protein
MPDAPNRPSAAQPGGQSARSILHTGGAAIEVDIKLADSALQTEDVLAWVRRATEAVATYYGDFPVRRARVSVIQTKDDDRSIHGTTWGNIDGYQGVSRMRLGRIVSSADLEADWTMTHELVHMAFASLSDEHHWLEEGLATYVEPIARSQDGQLSAEKVWGDLVSDMDQGEPRSGDHGLDQTHTWGRTYWGGAMFCLVADVEIRRATTNRKGLQDALRAIAAAGHTINTESELSSVLQLGDRSTGTTILSDLYRSWKDTPVHVNLNQLWDQLGIQRGPHGIKLSDAAPLANIRKAITAKPLR